MQNQLDISVVMPTYNRAEILRESLESMTKLDLDGFSVELVIADNNSSDHTRQVIRSFHDRLPLRYLFEPRPGKYVALNRALETITTGRVLVFIDDDVSPCQRWLRAIQSMCERWPACSVFGGKIELLWPCDVLPRWTRMQAVQEGIFGFHDHGKVERHYPAGQYPYGANFWVRREVFEVGHHRFDESLGPKESDIVTGGDTAFFWQLAREGYEIMYCSDAVVRHRIKPEDICQKRVLRRALSNARLTPHMEGLCRRELLEKNAPFWYLLRMGALAWAAVRYVQPLRFLSRCGGMEKAITAAADTGYNLESLRIAWKRRKKAASVVELQ